ncbi:MAG TPA: hypothetical protein VK629_21700 [Steroidobacteraceae bacterium]|nr:hypothetical protein [Steroidobacteraceae bacterium]
MIWLFVITILILLIASAVFRKYALGLLVVGVVIGGVIYLINEQQQNAALTRIALSELKLEGVALIPDYGGYKLTGRIQNNSKQFTLNQLTLVVSIKDCTGDLSSQTCVTIGESTESFYPQIPPGQARDFNRAMYFSGGGPKPKGRMEWHYVVSKIQGK